MSNSNYSIGLQRLKPVDTAYDAICMPIRKLLMHWHHSSTSQLCIYGEGPLHDYILLVAELLIYNWYETTTVTYHYSSGIQVLTNWPSTAVSALDA